MTTFWSWYVTILSLGTIFALTWLIFGTRKGQRQETTEETVGHSFDGIEEYDNPCMHAGESCRRATSSRRRPGRTPARAPAPNRPRRG